MLLPLSVSPAPVVPLKKQTSAATLSELRHQLGTKEAVPLSVLSKNPVFDHMSFTQESNHTF